VWCELVRTRARFPSGLFLACFILTAWTIVIASIAWSRKFTSRNMSCWKFCISWRAAMIL
jgi:hypothetical protein